MLLSDGYSTTGVDPLTVARQSKSEGIRIDTVALGTSHGTIRVGNQNVVVPPDPQALSQVATVSGGEPFTVLDATHLSCGLSATRHQAFTQARQAGNHR